MVTIEKLKASVGSMLLLWSSIEQDLRQANAKLSTGSSDRNPHGIARTLHRWKELHDNLGVSHPEHEQIVQRTHAYLSKSLDTRNRIAHGMVGYGVGSSGDRDGAYLETRLNDEEIRFTYAEIETTLEGLSRLRSILSSLTAVTQRRDGRNLDDLYAELLKRVPHTPTG